MKSLLQKLVRASVAAGLCLVAGLSANAQDETPGIVRITKPTTAAMSAKGGRVTPAGFKHGMYDSNCDCQNGGVGGGSCPSGDCYGGRGFGLFGCGKGCGKGCGGGCCGGCCDGMGDYFRCKFGYFIPTGAGGAGVPFAGKYSRVYPQDPYYFDGRDGMAWAAQGYGVPVAVPLAPVVGHTYNYSWGTPSSRLTPVSRPAY